MPMQVWRSVRVLVPALAAFLLAGAGAAAPPPFKTMKDKTLKVCLYSGFAPFSSIVGNEWTGWDVDFLKAFANKYGLTWEVVPTPFDDIWLQPGKGACDIAGSGISDTAERRGTTKTGGCWSSTYYGLVRDGAYYGVLRSFLVRQGDAKNLTKVEDLQGKTAIVTKGSTANVDLCYRMLVANREALKKKTAPLMFPCKKACDDHPCKDLLSEMPEKDPARFKSCVQIDYPPYQNEANAACAVGHGSNTDGPFVYGGGYGSIVTLEQETPGTALVWTHCNVTSYKGKIDGYTEPFSFVVASQDKGLPKALNDFIRDNPKLYQGTPIVDPPPPSCPVPPWTQEPAPAACTAQP